MAFEGKVYAVTGGASGIGLATAKLLAQRGATVCIADVDADALKTVQSSLNSTLSKVIITTTRVDISKKDQVQSWMAGIRERFGHLDGAANIAGVTGKDHGLKTTAELDDDEWDKIIGVNLTGTMYCLREELKMIKDGGSIVNMASIHATVGTIHPPRPNHTSLELN